MYFGDASSSVIDNQGFGSLGNTLYLLAGGAERLYLTSSGNLGLGVTPSAWGSILRAQQIGNYGAFIAGRTDSVNQVFIGVNGYYNGTNWIYSNTSSASRYYQESGAHYWDQAPSGTAGNAISFTQAMTLGSNSGLSIGTPSAAPSQGLLVQGEGRFSGKVIIGAGSSATSQLDVTSDGAANGITLRNRVTDDYAFFNWRNYNGTELLAEQYIQRTAANTATMRYTINNGGIPATYLTIASTGAATFSSSVTAGGTITLNAPSANYATLNLNGAAGYGAELKFGEATGGYLAAIRHNYNVGTGLEFYTGGLSGGNLRMYIAPSGNVGIGTASPNSLLNVVGNGAANGLTIKSSGNVGTYPFRVTWSGGTDGSWFCVNDSGNVGIGTTSPTAKLEVVGGTINNQIARFITADFPTHSIGLGVDAAGSEWGASIFQDDVKRFTIDGNGGILVGSSYQSSNAPANGAIIQGNVGIGTTSPTAVNNYTTLDLRGTNGGIMYFGTSSTSSLRLIGEGTETFIENLSTGSLIFRTTSSSAERMRITSGGELQLKQSSNSAQNSVIFNTTIQNAMTLNSSGFLILNGTTGSSRITCYGDGYFSGGIQTGNPYGSTSANWLLGRFLTETTSANGSIRVQIGSKYYNIAAEDLGEVPT
jgi:hypothetical protein